MLFLFFNSYLFSPSFLPLLFLLSPSSSSYPITSMWWFPQFSLSFPGSGAPRSRTLSIPAWRNKHLWNDLVTNPGCLLEWIWYLTVCFWKLHFYFNIYTNEWIQSRILSMWCNLQNAFLFHNTTKLCELETFFYLCCLSWRYGTLHLFCMFFPFYIILAILDYSRPFWTSTLSCMMGTFKILAKTATLPAVDGPAWLGALSSWLVPGTWDWREDRGTAPAGSALPRLSLFPDDKQQVITVKFDQIY